MDARELTSGFSIMSKACCGIVACGLSTLPMVFMVYLYIYAFWNPDPEAWYGLVSSQDGPVPQLFESEKAGNLQDASSLININRQYMTWFQWGFF